MDEVNVDEKGRKEKNAVTISSSTLFNFMKKYEYLVQALEEGLWPRYSVEPDWNRKHFAIPMLCFCDIPLSHIKKHLSDYGEYGIGVTKDFARKHDITPVQYVASGTKMDNKIRYYIHSYKEPKNGEMSYEEYMLYYLKKVNGKNCENQICKFYDEREWRFIPSITKEVHLNIFTDLKEALNKRDELSEGTKQMRVKIDSNDISYIVVSTDGDKKKLIKKIDNIYQTKEVADLMKTKIITCKQIREDF